VRKSKHPHVYKSSLFAITLILVFLGAVSVANVSAPDAISLYSDKFYFAKQYLFWASLGIVSMIVVSRIDINYWKKIAVPFYFFSLGLLVLVLIPGIGSQIYGARRWIVFGGFSIQPSEVAKLALAIYIAKVSSSQKGVLSYLVPLGLTFLLIILEPDLGTALIIVAIGMSQIFISGINMLYVSAVSILGGVLTSLIIFFSDYRKQRLITFLQQTSDPLGEGYHIRQILLALGSGGLFGIGLGQSRQKFSFLPEVCTDSAFAIIAEELGFVGALVIFSLFMFYIYQGIKIAISAREDFQKVLVVGLITWIGGQIFLNVGSTVALIPLTGVPLPFLSCGGSSLVMILIATGILLAIARDNEKKK